MNIVWYGQSCFKITAQGQKKSKQWTSLVVDPFDERTGLKLPKMEANILLITHDHFDHSNRNAFKKEPFTIDSPGEYELNDIFIKGIHSFHDNSEGSERGANTIYVIEGEGMRVCHMGDFGQEELTSKQLESIGEVDILMVPVGGVYTIDGKGATKVISQIEPRVVIPMHYKVEGLNIEIEDLEQFLKAIGEKGVSREEKLAIQEKDLPSGEMRVVPLAPQAK